MKMIVIQHNSVEGPGLIADWAKAHNYDVQIVRPDRGDSLSQWRPDQIDFLVVMGGNPSVYDQDRWLKPERDLIRRVSQAQKPVLGICLGAQQIALTFGALVTRNTTPEIGWLPIKKSNQNPLDVTDQLTVLHWHQDQFTLPVDSQRLYKTRIDLNQGFIINHRIVGLQFHPEMDSAEIKALTQHDAQFIKQSDAPNAVQQTADQINSHPVPKADQQLLNQILDQMNRTQD